MKCIVYICFTVAGLGLGSIPGGVLGFAIAGFILAIVKRSHQPRQVVIVTPEDLEIKG